MTKIHDSMSEVSTGSTETAEAIQAQLERTEQIQDQISSLVWFASSEICPATTAKPLPDSPARAASMLALEKHE